MANNEARLKHEIEKKKNRVIRSAISSLPRTKFLAFLRAFSTESSKVHRDRPFKKGDKLTR